VASAGSVADLGTSCVEFDVALLDLLARHAGPVLAAVRELSGRGHVVASSTWGPLPSLGAVVRAGARGYVTHRCDPEVVLAALSTVARGGMYVCSELGDRFHSELARNVAENPIGLAPREVETLRWIARGLTHAQIGRRMGLTEATVSTYAKRIRAKLNAGNKAELTRLAIELGHLVGDDRRHSAA
jgi:DNA-binding NarL/FixJ family response regulator